MDPAVDSSWRRFARAAYGWFAAFFLACVILQVLLAGYGVLGGGTMLAHTTFIHWFEFVPLLLVLLGATGRLGRASWVWGIVLLVLIELQYVFANVPWLPLRSLHTVNALAIFAAAWHLTLRWWKPLLRSTASPA